MDARSATGEGAEGNPGVVPSKAAWVLGGAMALVVAGIVVIGLVLFGLSRDVDDLADSVDDLSSDVAGLSEQALLGGAADLRDPSLGDAVPSGAGTSRYRPVDEAAARSAITESALTVFSPATDVAIRTSLLDDVSPEVVSAVDQVVASRCAADSYPLVTSIEFLDDDAAVVVLAFQGSTVEGLGYDRSVGTPVEVSRVGDGWVVSGGSVVEFAGVVDQYCA